MDTSRSSQKGVWDEWWDLVIRVVAVWGTALMLAELLNQALIGALTRGTRMGISLILTFLLVGAFFWGGEKWPRLRDRFYSGRIPLAMIFAVYIGWLVGR